MIAIQTALARSRQIAALLPRDSGVLLQALVIPGDKTNEGQLIQAAAVPWFKIVDMLKKDPPPHTNSTGGSGRK